MFSVVVFERGLKMLQWQ